MVARKKTTEDIFALRSCGTCQHWERLPKESQSPCEDVAGECLLDPPKVLGFDEMGDLQQGSPIVSSRHRCGKHAPQVN